jgi:hypothetical protein
MSQEMLLTILGVLLLINFAAMSTIKYSRNPKGKEESLKKLYLILIIVVLATNGVNLVLLWKNLSAHNITFDALSIAFTLFSIFNVRPKLMNCYGRMYYSKK